jgi:UDP-glucose 4-epimerase
MSFVLGRDVPDATGRVVVVGANGVIGYELCAGLTKIGRSLLPLRGASCLDLATSGSDRRLADMLEPSDAVVMLAALTPDRGLDAQTMCRNLAMAANVCEAISARQVSHVIYVSSDAVYPRRIEVVDEASCAEGGDTYSVMHQVRELMFRSAAGDRLAILRPTQVYASTDTHGAYGPCRFLRSARASGRIELFGEGEETRDHISVRDLVAILLRCLDWRATGLLNVASGFSLSFRDIADMAAAICRPTPDIVHLPRNVPVTHRRFETRLLRTAFPDFRFTPPEDGLRDMHEHMVDRVGKSTGPGDSRE